ncbi:MAG: questin oxidase family protein [Bdellovibrionota bacterium]
MEKLSYLIEKGQMFSSEYQLGDLKGVSNHLPMCLYARSKIGATDDQLAWFYERYIPKLELKNSQLQEIKWQEQLGKHKFNSDYLKFFTLKCKSTELMLCC